MKVTTFLSERAQRVAFAAWLRGVVAQSGKSKGQVSKALGYDTIGRLNRYLRADVFPTARTAVKIAEFCGVWPIEALWRGGFYRELFTEMTALAAVSHRNRLRLAEALVLCFPRRGDRYRSLPTHDMRSATRLSDHFLGLQRAQGAAEELSNELARASDVAYDTALPQDTRRAIIAELCDAWARRITALDSLDGLRSAWFAECGIADEATSGA